MHLSVACFTVYNNVANEVRHFDKDLPVNGGGGGGGRTRKLVYYRSGLPWSKVFWTPKRGIDFIENFI